MKTYNATELGSRKRTEIFEAARTEGAVIQRKNTNGVVLEEFVMVNASGGILAHSVMEIYPHEGAELRGVYLKMEDASTEKRRLKLADTTNGYNEFDIEEIRIK